MLAELTEKYIWVTFQVEGTHRYPEAETDPSLKTGGWDDVSFLAFPHRHTFHFKVYIEVKHNNRDREFIQEQRFMKRLFGDKIDIDFKSCEMLADDLYAELKKRYEGEERRIVIEVSEDNENGCSISYPST